MAYISVLTVKKNKKIAVTRNIEKVAFAVAFLLALFLCLVWVEIASIPDSVEVMLGFATLACLFIYFVARFTALYFEGALSLK